MQTTKRRLKKRGIASIERPVLALRILHFLQKGYKATLSDMVAQGWNRKTIDKSLRILGELKLVDVETRSSFPKFEKWYFLTESGELTAAFVSHMKREFESCLACDFEDLSSFPKGCLSIMVHLVRRGWVGATRMIKKVDISQTQVYVCLGFLVSRGIILREKGKGGRRTSTYRLTKKGIDAAIAAEALDRALRRASD